MASLFGCVVGGLSLFMLLVALFEMDEKDASVLIALLLLLALCVFSIAKGAQIKRRIRRFKRYVSLISAQGMTSLESIAASTKQSLDFVRNDLQKMITKKFFAHAAIDFATDSILIGGSGASVAASPPAQTHAPAEYEPFACPGCGATGKKMKGIPYDCEYCGSFLP